MRSRVPRTAYGCASGLGEGFDAMDAYNCGKIVISCGQAMSVKKSRWPPRLTTWTAPSAFSPRVPVHRVEGAGEAAEEVVGAVEGVAKKITVSGPLLPLFPPLAA